MTAAEQKMSTPQVQAPPQAAWDRIAAGYDTFTTALNMPLGEEALRRIDLRPGMRFLDVAAGTGALSLPAARRGAQVLATDLSPGMVDRLRARARAEGLSNLESRVMDGQALALEDAAFDVSGSQFGVMLFPDLPRGLREMVRVTRPGGWVLMVAFGAPARTEFLGVFLDALQAVLPGFAGLSLDPPPLPFQVAAPEKLHREMAGAGLKDVRIEAVNHSMAFRSGRHMWDAVTNSNPIGAALVADLTEEQRADVRQALDDRLRARSSGGGPAVLNNPVNVGIGTK